MAIPLQVSHFSSIRPLSSPIAISSSPDPGCPLPSNLYILPAQPGEDDPVFLLAKEWLEGYRKERSAGYFPSSPPIELSVHSRLTPASSYKFIHLLGGISRAGGIG